MNISNKIKPLNMSIQTSKIKSKIWIIFAEIIILLDTANVSENLVKTDYEIVEWHSEN